MKITKIRVSNFMGIEAREIAVPPGGFVARGENGLGKSSILHPKRGRTRRDPRRHRRRNGHARDYEEVVHGLSAQHLVLALLVLLRVILAPVGAWVVMEWDRVGE